MKKQIIFITLLFLSIIMFSCKKTSDGPQDYDLDVKVIPNYNIGAFGPNTEKIIGSYQVFNPGSTDKTLYGVSFKFSGFDEIADTIFVKWSNSSVWSIVQTNYSSTFSINQILRAYGGSTPYLNVKVKTKNYVSQGSPTILSISILSINTASGSIVPKSSNTISFSVD